MHNPISDKQDDVCFPAECTADTPAATDKCSCLYEYTPSAGATDAIALCEKTELCNGKTGGNSVITDASFIQTAKPDLTAETTEPDHAKVCIPACTPNEEVTAMCHCVFEDQAGGPDQIFLCDPLTPGSGTADDKVFCVPDQTALAAAATESDVCGNAAPTT
jgi:hypothetical protein